MSLILSGTNGLSDVDGSAATPAIRGTDANTGIFFPAADTIAFAEGGTETMRLDSSGNMGLGVTPSAWGSNRRAIQVGSSAVAVGYFAGSAPNTIFGNNFYHDGTNVRYVNAGAPAQAIVMPNDGSFAWAQYTGNLGAGNIPSLSTTAMTLDASGNLLVGGTAQVFGEKLLLKTASGDCYTTMSNGTGSVYVGWSSSGVGFMGTATNHAQTFYTNGSERARIDSSGNLLVGNTSALNSNARLSVWNSSSTGSVGIATGYGTTFGQFRLIYLNSSASNSLVFDSGTNNATLTAAGAWTNASDARLKNSIVEIKYGLADVMKAQPRSYKMNDLEGDYIGFVAQEMQQVIPEFVPMSQKSIFTGDKADTELVPSGVYYEKLSSVLIKAIQEQQALIASQSEIITQLQADVQALKGNA